MTAFPLTDLPTHVSASSSTTDLLQRLRVEIDHAAHLLPAQGPITVFIHHNTLHAFEHLPFDTAVKQAASIFGCEPYLSEDRYRDELVRGRIRFDSLRTILQADLGDRANDLVVGLVSRLELRLAMLTCPIWTGPADELRWFMEETDALRRCRSDVSATERGRLISETQRWVMRDVRGNAAHRELFVGFDERSIESWDSATWEAFALQALWHVCRTGVRSVRPAVSSPSGFLRPRDLLFRLTGLDIDTWVHEVLIRFCAAFLDQGVAHWPLPNRSAGLYHSFLKMYRLWGGPRERWLSSLSAEAARLQDQKVGPLESILESLVALGVSEEEWGEFLSATLLALRGWGGMVREVESRGDRVPHPIPPGSLVEFVAIRLLLDRVALGHAAAEELGLVGPLSRVRSELSRRLPPPVPIAAEQRAMPVFQLAQIFGWSPGELHSLSCEAWPLLLHEIESFNEIERRRIFHLAYEKQLRVRTLDALALHAPRRRVGPPRLQVITCLDEREESYRRHLEELAPDCDTYGTAGFFAVPMYYRGAAEAYFVPLCPIVMTPNNWVEEEPVEEKVHRRVRKVQKALGVAAHKAHVGTRSLAVGALLTTTFGMLASLPLVGRTLFPRLAAQLRRLFGRAVQHPPQTCLSLERAPGIEPSPENGHRGFTLSEMAAMTERLLRDIGLVDQFARLVLILGHGSGSLNNPHRSAYDCGACGGSPGAPNARALAAMLNNRSVRLKLADRGILIPDTSWFVGGYHNTCDDSVSLFDQDLPASHRRELEQIQHKLDQASDRNAHERCRRFMSAPLTLTPAEARRHVEARSEDLAQTRPELGHATNAICYVGRRERTRGLFFDRRAFLASYDPTQDDAVGTILARTLTAVFPVCGGISLEYYFSHVDAAGYGAGTKLPHNVTSMLGVMDGAQSDLRTGLPWQMTEIHEPVRLLIVCECTPRVMHHILANNQVIQRMTENAWVQLALQSPDTGAISVYQAGEFRPYTPRVSQLPTAPTSADWYRGWRGHLEFAEIG